MAWIEFNIRLRDHWKIDRFKDIIHVEYAHALGILACLWTWAAEHAQDGDISGFTLDEIARAARWCGDKTILFDALKSCNLIDDGNKIHDWKKHGLRLLLSSRKRAAKFRKSSRYNNTDHAVTVPPTNLTLPNHTIPDPTKPIKEEAASPRTQPGRFTKPTAEEVAAYGRAIGFSLSGKQFCDFYESKGWRVGTSPMKNWQAAVRTWKAKEAGNAIQQPIAGAWQGKETVVKMDAERKVMDALEAEFNRDYAAAKASADFKEILEEAKKRIPPDVKFGVDTIMLPQKIVEIYRERGGRK